MDDYLAETRAATMLLDTVALENMVSLLAGVRNQEGRVFFLGSGGGAGHASHAVNDFRKLCGFEAYTPSDNASELTARVNDEGWDTCYVEWLKGSRLCEHDAVFVFSVGGGSIEHGISVNLALAVQHAERMGATVIGIVGRDGGETAKRADACVIVTGDTPQVEGMQAVLWHLIVSHPWLALNPTKWEAA